MKEQIIEFLYSKFLQSEGVSTDTRTIQPGSMFFALKGPNYNANQYAGQALESGARFAVVDEDKYVTDSRTILVPDGLQALQQLATFHRARFKGPVLAITGSNGKTTTKELVHAVLSAAYKTYTTQGNLNNHIGVPLTLLQIHPQCELAVIEMGANKQGDIHELCQYARPTHGLITNIGEAHTEGFGGLEGVRKGKGELFRYLKSTSGLPFINLADDRLKEETDNFETFVPFPPDDLQLISADPLITFRLGKRETRSQLIGGYNFPNIAATVSVGRQFQVSDEKIVEAIASYAPSNQRSQLLHKQGITIILDAYNANPSSMKAALDNLRTIPGTKSVILGDMKEMEHPDSAHTELGKHLRELDLDHILLVGEYMEWAHRQLPGSHWFENTDALREYLKNNAIKEGTVLIKASRALKLETVVEDVR